MTVSVDDIAKQMLALLPDDGTPVLNRVMRALMSRKLDSEISQEEFFAARDLLVTEGRVGRLRGPGGQVFLLKESAATEAAPTVGTQDRWTEAQLMPILEKYLNHQFRNELELPESAFCIIQDTSAMGPFRGRWARPDFIFVAARRFKFIPTPQLDVHSFELKTETGVNDLAVYEAFAQTRYTHFGHLVWHLPKGSKSEGRLEEIEKQCETHGVGLIRIIDPNDVGRCEILLDPTRKNTLPATVDDFLDLRLTDDQREKLWSAMYGAAP